MSLITLVVVLLLLAGLGWFVNVKMPFVTGVFKWLINFVLIVAAIILVLVAFGVWGDLKSIQVPKI